MRKRRKFKHFRRYSSLIKEMNSWKPKAKIQDDDRSDVFRQSKNFQKNEEKENPKKIDRLFESFTMDDKNDESSHQLNQSFKKSGWRPKQNNNEGKNPQNIDFYNNKNSLNNNQTFNNKSNLNKIQQDLVEKQENKNNKSFNNFVTNQPNNNNRRSSLQQNISNNDFNDKNIQKSNFYGFKSNNRVENNISKNSHPDNFNDEKSPNSQKINNTSNFSNKKGYNDRGINRNTFNDTQVDFMESEECGANQDCFKNNSNRQSIDNQNKPKWCPKPNGSQNNSFYNSDSKSFANFSSNQNDDTGSYCSQSKGLKSQNLNTFENRSRSNNKFNKSFQNDINESNKQSGGFKSINRTLYGETDTQDQNFGRNVNNQSFNSQNKLGWTSKSDNFQNQSKSNDTNFEVEIYTQIQDDESFNNQNKQFLDKKSYLYENNFKSDNKGSRHQNITKNQEIKVEETRSNFNINGKSNLTPKSNISKNSSKPHNTDFKDMCSTQNQDYGRKLENESNSSQNKQSLGFKSNNSQNYLKLNNKGFKNQDNTPNPDESLDETEYNFDRNRISWNPKSNDSVNKFQNNNKGFNNQKSSQINEENTSNLEPKNNHLQNKQNFNNRNSMKNSFGNKIQKDDKFMEDQNNEDEGIQSKAFPKHKKNNFNPQKSDLSPKNDQNSSNKKSFSNEQKNDNLIVCGNLSYSGWAPKSKADIKSNFGTSKNIDWNTYEKPNRKPIESPENIEKDSNSLSINKDRDFKNVHSSNIYENMDNVKNSMNDVDSSFNKSSSIKHKLQSKAAENLQERNSNRKFNNRNSSGFQNKTFNQDDYNEKSSLNRGFCNSVDNKSDSFSTIIKTPQKSFKPLNSQNSDWNINISKNQCSNMFKKGSGDQSISVISQGFKNPVHSSLITQEANFTQISYNSKNTLSNDFENSNFEINTLTEDSTMKIDDNFEKPNRSFRNHPNNQGKVGFQPKNANISQNKRFWKSKCDIDIKPKANENRIITKDDGEYEINELKETSNSCEASPLLDKDDDIIKNVMELKNREKSSIQSIEKWSSTYMGVPVANNGFEGISEEITSTLPIDECIDDSRNNHKKTGSFRDRSQFNHIGRPPYNRNSQKHNRIDNRQENDVSGFRQKPESMGFKPKSKIQSYNYEQKPKEIVQKEPIDCFLPPNRGLGKLYSDINQNSEIQKDSLIKNNNIIVDDRENTEYNELNFNNQQDSSSTEVKNKSNWAPKSKLNSDSKKSDNFDNSSKNSRFGGFSNPKKANNTDSFKPQSFNRDEDFHNSDENEDINKNMNLKTKPDQNPMKFSYKSKSNEREFQASNMRNSGFKMQNSSKVPQNMDFEQKAPNDNMSSISRNSIMTDQNNQNDTNLDEWNDSEKLSQNFSKQQNLSSKASWRPKNDNRNFNTSNVISQKFNPRNESQNTQENFVTAGFTENKSKWNQKPSQNIQKQATDQNNQNRYQDNLNTGSFNDNQYYSDKLCNRDSSNFKKSTKIHQNERSNCKTQIDINYDEKSNKNNFWKPKNTNKYNSNLQKMLINDFDQTDSRNTKNPPQYEEENNLYCQESVSVCLGSRNTPSHSQREENYIKNESLSMIEFSNERHPRIPAKAFENSKIDNKKDLNRSENNYSKSNMSNRSLNAHPHFDMEQNTLFMPDKGLNLGPTKPFKLKKNLPPVVSRTKEMDKSNSLNQLNDLSNDVSNLSLNNTLFQEETTKHISINKTVLLEPHELSSSKIKSFEEMRLSKNIKYTLETFGIKEPSLIMKNAWKILVKQTFSTLISPKNSGLTTLGITYILNCFYDIIITSEKVNPMVLIICNSWESVETTNELINCFKFPHKRLKVQKCYTGVLESKDSIHQLVQGCDILVTTVSTAIEAYNRHYVSFDDIKCVIVDDISDILDSQYNKFRLLLSFVHTCESITFLSHFWNKKIQNVINQKSNLIITDPIEIASYKSLEFKIKLCYESDNLSQIQEATKASERCIISVGSALEADNTVQMLNQNGIIAIKVTEFLSPDELSSIKGIWERSSNLALVISDNAIKNIKIYDCDTLISTIFPSTRDIFRSRMSLMSNSMIDDHKCFCLIMVNEKSLENLHVLFEHFKKMAGNIDFIDQDLLNRSLILRDEKYKELCENVKLFGSCYNYLSCKACHNMTFKFNNWPMKGKLRLKIVFIKSATHFFCRVLDHYDNDIVTKCDNNFGTITTTFQIDMLSSKRLSTPITKEFISSRSLVALKDDYGVYHRCYIVSIESYNEKVPAPKTFTAYCVDLGVNVKVDYMQLYEIPEEYRNIKPLVAEVVFIGIKPKNKEHSWSCAVDQLVKPHLMDKIVNASIVFSADNIIWVNQLTVSQNLSTLSSEMVSFSLKQFMLDHELAAANPSHETHFSKKISTLISVKEIKQEFQILNINEKYKVVITNIISDGRLYCILKDSESEINYLNSMITEKISEIPLLSNPDVNLKCLVEYQQNWSRGLIINLTEESSEVFLLDLGHYVNTKTKSLKEIPPDFLELPFQAIECRLYGHDDKDNISLSKLNDIFDILIGNTFDLIPLKNLTSRISSNISTFSVKLIKSNEDSSDLCLSQYLFFNCLITPDLEMLNDLFPVSGNGSKPWNYLIHSFFIMNDSSACDKMQLFLDCVSEEDKSALSCDIDLIKKWLDASASKFSNIDEPKNSLVEITPKNEAIDIDMEDLRVPVVDISPIIQSNSKVQEIVIDKENLKLPRTNWSQTDSSVYVLIPITNKCEANVSIYEQALSVNYTLDIAYGFDLKLFDKIDVSISHYDVNDSRIRIVLHKLNFGNDWDNLTSDYGHTSWLKYDWDYNPLPTVTPWSYARDACPSPPKRPSIVQKVVVEPEDAPGLAQEDQYDDELLSLPSDCYEDFVCSD